MITRNEPRTRVWQHLMPGVVALTVTSASLADEPESPSVSRFSDQPAPMLQKGFPERPPPLLELGSPFQGSGNLGSGFTIPGGANISPAFWVFGDYRTAIQTFDPGKGPTTSEWANRLDLYGNLQLTGLSRLLIGFRPFDKFEDGAERYSGYNFEPSQPSKYYGWQGRWNGEPTTLFFEGEVGELLPALHNKAGADYGFSVGRQPLVLQDGMLANDDMIDLVGISRNTLLPKGASVLRLTGLFGWNEIQRPTSVKDHDALLFGLDSAWDTMHSTFSATALAVTSDNQSDGFYSGLSMSRRFGQINTLFRVVNSVALQKESDRVHNGTLLFAETSFFPKGIRNMIYLNGFWGIDQFSSADAGPLAGGPMGRVGLLNEAVGIGRYDSALSSYPANAVGANLGYQMLFGAIPRTQLIFEIGGRAPTQTPVLESQKAAEAIGVRFQKAYGHRFVVEASTFAALREGDTFSFGARLEFLTKF